MYQLLTIRKSVIGAIFDTRIAAMTGDQVRAEVKSGPNREHVTQWLETNPDPGEWCVWYSRGVFFRLPETLGKVVPFGVRDQPTHKPQGAA